jgi:hypothetical protein
LAIVNLDWDNIKASDLFKVVESFTPPGGSIVSVKIYPSEFGKERMAKEAIEGPPKEIFNDKEDEDIDEAVRKELFSNQDESEFNPEKLREYQLERLRYYYAVVDCDSINTARNVYEGCDGAEFEKTSNVFDLRYIPSEMTFEGETDSATNASAVHQPVDFVTRALQQSNVKLTWDQDDRERVRVTQRKFTKEDLKKMDFDAYVASSDSESDREERKERLRNALVKDEESEEGGIEITFVPGLSSKAQELLDKREEKIAKNSESVFDAKRREKKEKKGKVEFDKQSDKSDSESDEFFQKPDKRKSSKKSKEEKQEDDKSRAELELLLADNSKVQHFDMKQVLDGEKKSKKRGKKASVPKDEFEVNVQDPRFASMFDSHEFAIDPTNPRHVFQLVPATILMHVVSRRLPIWKSC